MKAVPQTIELFGVGGEGGAAAGVVAILTAGVGTGTGAAGADTAGTGAAGTDVGTGDGVGGAGAAGGVTTAAFDSGRTKFANAATSSKLSTVTIIGAPTVTSEPFGTNNLAMKVSSTESKAMTALSVSTSAMVSPGATRSPALFFQLVMVPTAIVGERAGMPTT